MFAVPVTVTTTFLPPFTVMSPSVAVTPDSVALISVVAAAVRTVPATAVVFNVVRPVKACCV